MSKLLDKFWRNAKKSGDNETIAKDTTFANNADSLVNDIGFIQNSVCLFDKCQDEKDKLWVWDEYIQKNSAKLAYPIVDMLYINECSVEEVCLTAMQLVNFAVEKVHEHGLNGKLKPLKIVGWPVDNISTQ